MFSVVLYGEPGGRHSQLECYRGLPGFEFVLGDFGRGFVEAEITSRLDAMGK